MNTSRTFLAHTRHGQPRLAAVERQQAAFGDSNHAALEEGTASGGNGGMLIA
jgi:hypothetical protein